MLRRYPFFVLVTKEEKSRGRGVPGLLVVNILIALMFLAEVVESKDIEINSVFESRIAFHHQVHVRPFVEVIVIIVFFENHYAIAIKYLKRIVERPFYTIQAQQVVSPSPFGSGSNYPVPGYDTFVSHPRYLLL